MSEFKVSFDGYHYTSKPSDYNTVARISNKIAKNSYSINQDNIKLFAKMVGEYGCTFCPTTFTGGERKKITSINYSC